MSSFNLKINNKIAGLLVSQIDPATGKKPNPVSVPMYQTLIPKSELELAYDRIETLENEKAHLQLELDKTREQAYVDGFGEGFTKGHHELETRMNAVMQGFISSASTLSSQFEDQLLALNEPLLDLALSAAEKIVGQELEYNDEKRTMLKNRIKDILAIVVENSAITIKIDPSSMEHLSKSRHVHEKEIFDGKSVNFKADKGLKPGECTVITNEFVVDARISREIENIGYALRESLKLKKSSPVAVESQDNVR